jgi:hypothetical protein
VACGVRPAVGLLASGERPAVALADGRSPPTAVGPALGDAVRLTAGDAVGAAVGRLVAVRTVEAVGLSL